MTKTHKPKPRNHLSGSTIAVVKDHRNGSLVIPKRLLNEVRRTVALTKADGARAISARRAICDSLKAEGWPNQVRVTSESDIKVTSLKDKTALCLQTGNMSRLYADLLKIQKLYLKGDIVGGVLVLPSKLLARVWGKSDSNLVNAERSLKEMSVFGDIITVPIVLIVISTPEEA